ncbi:hypothetical protein [Limnohabitans sp. 63ED37-2]|uniref:hypothetical protein n=1 Tax=Limnohabitans sp. 63ED37-2 TaxID=1678128 RepID=UPI0012E319B8|nr:hypothetical protein [Limnohabitans sp. 63ED37-2]
MFTKSERDSVWEAWLDSEYQKRYWHAKATQFSNRERKLQILLAILSSSALLALLGDLAQLWIWKILSFLTASLATIQPFLNYTRDTHKMHDIGSQWHQLEIEFEAIWRTLESNGFSEKKFKELKNQTVEISKKATELPSDDQTLQNECQKALLKFRGLKND